MCFAHHYTYCVLFIWYRTARSTASIQQLIITRFFVRATQRRSNAPKNISLHTLISRNANSLPPDTTSSDRLMSCLSRHWSTGDGATSWQTHCGKVSNTWLTSKSNWKIHRKLWPGLWKYASCLGAMKQQTCCRTGSWIMHHFLSCCLTYRIWSRHSTSFA